MFKKTIFEILISMFTIIGGYSIYQTGLDPKHNIPVPKFVGIALIISGLYGFIRAIKNRRLTTSDNFLICYSCKDIIHKTLSNDYMCKSCGGSLEELRGFYERHPEFKKEKT